MRRERLPLILVILTFFLFSNKGISAQELTFQEFSQLYSLKNFYHQKIVNNDVFNTADFHPGAVNHVPLWEMYHHSNVYALSVDDEKLWFGNLQAGSRLAIPLQKPLQRRTADAWDELLYELRVSQLEFFVLGNMDFVSAPTNIYPVLEIPFPYLLSQTRANEQFLAGGGFSIGAAWEPLLKVTGGLSSTGNPNDLFFFDIRSPRLGAFLEVFQKEGANWRRWGLESRFQWLTRIISKRPPFFESMSLYHEYDIMNKTRNYHAGLTKAFGFMDLQYQFQLDDNFSQLTPQWWRCGINLRLDPDREYSTIYKTMLNFKGGVTYVNHWDISGTQPWDWFIPLPDSSLYQSSQEFAGIPGLGYYVEFTLQNPFLKSLDWFLILFFINLGFADLIVGDGDNYDTCFETAGDLFKAMLRKDNNGNYEGNLFSRLTIGYELNNPQAVEPHPFVYGEDHFYVYINVFL